MFTNRLFVVLAAALLGLTGCQSARPDGLPLYTQVVAADQPLASQAGARMLERGGNAVDAAVAAAFTLSVVRPQSCGMGGGGFMVIHLPPAATRSGVPVDIAINARERCPGGVWSGTFESSGDPTASTIGGLAVAVPSSVAGLLHAQERYGMLERSEVLQPAIDAASGGFIVDSAYMTAAAATIEKFRADASLQTRFAFLWTTLLKSGSVREGDRITNPAQAAALREIARSGRHAFYVGPVAEAIVRATREAGGVITHMDLQRCLESGVSEVPPLRAFALGHTFLTMPPPSSGGVALVQVVSMLGLRGADRLVGVDEPAFAHELTECFKLAFADRAAFMADPAFSPVPVSGLLSKDDLAARAAMIDASRTFGPERYARSSVPTRSPPDHGTSHVSAVDRWGGACAATETINLSFGSWVCAEPYGFLLNNQMDDFTTRRGASNAFGLTQSAANAPKPGKRPLSSMTPTIVLDADGRVEAVAGASGGPRIITATTQALINALVRGDDAEAAVSRARLHHQWMPGTLWLEPLPDPLDAERMTESLAAKGHAIKPAKGEAAVQLIARWGTPRGLAPAMYTAGSDPRKGGTPAGTRAN